MPRLSKLLILTLTLGVFLCALEFGVQIWRYFGEMPSTSPVFSYPPASACFGQSASLAPAIELYRVDRAAECKLSAADHTRLTVLYFEWDCMKPSPVMDFALHAPEVCNARMGFKLLKVLPSRNYDVPGRPSLTFDATHFVDPAGGDVFIFKTVWLQGSGCPKLRGVGPDGGSVREADYRFVRLKNSFFRRRGAARILEAGVYDARDPDHAWSTFRELVLDQILWSDSRARD
jgi:hypothetical protein